MAISWDSFDKIWASTSPLTPYSFSDQNYAQGWNFVGSTPPARQMWDSLQKQNDEKMKFLAELTQMIVPVGVIQAFAGNTIPDGWLSCDGSAVSRTDYADLYAVIGDTYGNGDGTSTFNLPNLIDKFVEGSATAGTTKQAGLPNITGSIYSRIPRVADSGGTATAFTDDKGSLYSDSEGTVYYFNSAGITTANVKRRLNIDASISSSIYGNSTTVQPPAVTMRYIIKY